MVTKKYEAMMVFSVVSGDEATAALAEKFKALCHPVYGIEAYDAMLKYIEDVKKYVPDVSASVVGVISRESIEACRAKAEALGVRFRVR